MYEKFLEMIKNNKVIAILLIAGTIVATLANFYDTIRKTAVPLFARDKILDMGVSLASNDDPAVKKKRKYEYLIPKYGYSENLSNHIKVIQPAIPYFNSFYKEKFIQVQDIAYYSPPAFEIYQPILDIKFVNNNDKTVILDRLSLDVAASALDERPLIYLCTTCSADLYTLTMVNESPAKWHDCLIRFNLNKDKSDKDSFSLHNKNFKYTKTISYFDKVNRWDISPFLAREGIEVLSGKIPANGLVHQNKSENFRTVIMEGEMVIRDEFSNSIHQALFTADIPLDSQPAGGILEPLQNYDMQFQTEGSNYRMDQALSVSLQPKESQRVLLSLGAKKTSRHKFRVVLHDINNKEIKSEWISLDLYLPKVKEE